MFIKTKTTAGTEFPNVNTFNIYANGKILYSTNYNYLQDHEIRKNSFGHDVYESVYDGKPTTLYLNKEIKRAIKVNLDRKDNYYINVPDPVLYRMMATNIYIHASEINVEFLGDLLSMETSEERDYIPTYKLTFIAGVEYRRCYAEKIRTNGHWKIPGNGKWSDCYGSKESPCYSIYDHSKSLFKGDNADPNDKGVIKRWYEIEFLENHPAICTGDKYSKIEYSEKRLLAKEIAKDLTEKKVFYKDVSYHEIESLMQFYDIKKK